MAASIATRFAGRRLPLALLAVAVVLGLGLRVVVIADKPALGHDEAISYLAATCHQGEWNRVTTRGLPPVGSWVPADRWRRFLDTDRFLCFGAIGGDLARLDIHPPLYFWLLHVWVEAFGVSKASGPLLNLPIFLALALALFAFARRMLGDSLEAALVVLVWAVSPAVVPIASEARMYDLLALVSVLFVWQVVRVTDEGRDSRRELAMLAAGAACGLATAFSFLLVAASAALYMTVRLARARPRRLAAALAAMALGFGAFFAVDPGFPKSFDTQQEQRSEVSAEMLGSRIDRTATGFAGFVYPRQWLSRGGSYALLAALAGAALAAALALRRRSRLEGNRELLQGSRVVFFAATIGLGTTALYLTFRTPGTAMGGKYLAACWPFLAFGPVLALRVLRRGRAAAAALLCAALLAAGLAAALLTHSGDAQPRDPSPHLSRSGRVVADTLRRGVLLPVVLQLRPEDRVYAASQEALLRSPVRWSPWLQGASLYVSDSYYGDARREKAILRTIERRHRVERIEPPPTGAFTSVFLVRSPAAPRLAGPSRTIRLWRALARTPASTGGAFS